MKTAAISAFIALTLTAISTSHLHAQSAAAAPKTQYPSKGNSKPLRYTIQELVKLEPWYQFYDLFINNNGVVCGVDDQLQPWVYEDGRFHTFKVLNSKDASPTGINDKNEIIGLYGSNYEFSFLRDATPEHKIHKIATGDPARTHTSANSINSKGEVVGDIDTYDRTRSDGERTITSFIYKDGSLSDLNIPNLSAKYQRAEFINDSDQIAGEFSNTDTPVDWHAFVTEDDRVVDLTSLVGEPCIPMALNNRGDVLLETESKVFLYSEGKILDLNQELDIRFPVNGAALNNNLEAVGFREDGNSFWYSEEQTLPLETMVDGFSPNGWGISAFSINDKRQIAAQIIFHVPGSDHVPDPRIVILNPLE